MKKLIAVLLTAGMVMASLAGCGSSAPAAETTTAQSTAAAESTTAETAAAETTAASDGTVDYEGTKVAMLLPGSANDGSFNTKGYNALMHLKDLGCDTAYSENVTASDQLQALRDYAGMGYNVIIGWGSQFDDDMKAVAEEYPDIQFCIASGTVGNDTNLTSVYVSGAHLGYGYGYLAALVSKTGKVAFIGANQGNQAYTDEVCGFIEGAKAANPDTEVTILYVSDYSDVAEANETANLCVEKGCDVIFGDISEGYYGVLDVVKENNLYTFGRNASNVEDYPTGIITYIENNWSTKMEDVVKHYVTEGMLTGVTEVGFGTVVSGWDYKYDDSHEMNPDLITDDLAAQFKENVVDKISNEGYEHNFTADEANPGVY